MAGAIGEANVRHSRIEEYLIEEQLILPETSITIQKPSYCFRKFSHFLGSSPNLWQDVLKHHVVMFSLNCNQDEVQAMTGGFGRKGLSATGAHTPANRPTNDAAGLRNARPAARGPADDDDLARRREAFLAQERARRMEDGSHSATSYAGEMDRFRTGSFSSRPDRSMMLAYVFWWFAAGAAAHRFYLRAYPSAFAMLGLLWGGIALIAITGSGIPAVFVAGWFVWTIADAFLIPGLTRRANAPQHHLAFA